MFCVLGNTHDQEGNIKNDKFSYYILSKGHPPSVDLRHREEDSISHSTLVLAAIKS